MKKTILFLFFTVSICTFSQTVPSIKFVIEKGQFVFDNSGYLKFKVQNDEAIKSLRKMDSLKNLNLDKNYTHIDDRTISHARPTFPDSINWTKVLLSKIKVSKKTKKGENIFRLIIDKKGNPVKFFAEKTTDKNILQQVKNIFQSNEFNKWEPADFYGISVEYIFKFKLVIDDDFSKYDLNNKWARETDTNLPDFGKI